jgi:acetyl esterase/lipase
MTDPNVLYRPQAQADADEYIAERCRLDVYHPTNATGFTTVVWFHGGGLTGGNKFIPDKLRNQGLAVVAANYRLSPKVKCPVYIEDGAAAVAWTFENIARYGGDPNRIVVSGHSAGGYLTYMVGFDKQYLATHNIDADRIAALIPYSGQTVTHSTVRAERGIGRQRPIIDEFAALYHMRAEAPPLIITTGDRNLEIAGRYEENAYLARMMKFVGHESVELYELQGLDHGQMPEAAHIILLRHIKANR